MRGSVAARRGRALVAVLAVALTTGLVLFGTAGSAPASTGLQKVDARVLQAVQGGGSATYWAILGQKADLSGAVSITGWTARGWYVYDRLTGVANSSQKGLRSLLRSQGAKFTPFWIINAIRITSGSTTLAAVAARPEVARVVPSWAGHVVDGTPSPAAIRAGIQTVEWNIDRVNAPQVWSQYNDRGDGVAVGSIDTGVQWDHPALLHQYRGVHGTVSTVVNHNFNWWDPSHVCGNPSLTPCDNVGHGTHTMGTIVGDDGGTNQIGVAPKAWWLTAKGCESNSCSDFALLSSGQFMLAPTDLNGQHASPGLRPVVVSNSWGTPAGADTFYQATVQSWVAAGIFPDFANGNSGPACGTVGAPGSYPESYGVGAFDINNNIAAFSSRGPSPLGGGIKPNVSAPGVSVRSSLPGNSYGSLSGTSMATPHVAGTVALIVFGAPAFKGDVAGLRSVIDQTAIDVSNLTCGGSSGNNNVWGEGRLDAFGAVTKAKGLG
ncbi:MAG TPA: S8 family serine peptidase [Actinomycetota bacterium]|nr:S8 family serine peptidase [Actinomycetota bacterium]